MSELQAEQGVQTPMVSRTETKSARYRDVLIALIAFAVLALLPMLTSSKFLLDFVIRCAAYGLFATSLNLLVGYTGLTSFGHGMFFGLGAYGLGLMMQKTGVSVPVAFVGDAADHAGGRDRHRRDLRAAEGNLFRLRHAGVPDADPFHHPVMGVADRRRSGPARRHSAAGVFRHRPVEPSASLHR